MKILKTYDFISERVKIKPITNMEWEQVAKNVQTNNLAFDKKHIKCGTIVMFRDDTFGVYLDGDIAYEMAKFFGRERNAEPFYLTVTSENTLCTALLDINDFTDYLRYRLSYDADVVRIYCNPLTSNEIRSLENISFYSILKDMAGSRKYIERQLEDE